MSQGLPWSLRGTRICSDLYISGNSRYTAGPKLTEQYMYIGKELFFKTRAISQYQQKRRSTCELLWMHVLPLFNKERHHTCFNCQEVGMYMALPPTYLESSPVTAPSKLSRANANRNILQTVMLSNLVL